MDEEKREDIPMEDCTHDCSTCPSSCEIDPDAGPSFFERLESISEHFDEVGEENILDMLNEAVSQLEEEDAAEAANGGTLHTEEIEEAAEEVAEETAEKELGTDVEEVMEEDTEQK